MNFLNKQGNSATKGKAAVQISVDDAEESKQRDKEETWENLGEEEIPMDLQIKNLKDNDSRSAAQLLLMN